MKDFCFLNSGCVNASMTIADTYMPFPYNVKLIIIRKITESTITSKLRLNPCLYITNISMKRKIAYVITQRILFIVVTLNTRQGWNPFPVGLFIISFLKKIYIGVPIMEIPVSKSNSNSCGYIIWLLVILFITFLFTITIFLYFCYYLILVGKHVVFGFYLNWGKSVHNERLLFEMEKFMATTQKRNHLYNGMIWRRFWQQSWVNPLTSVKERMKRWALACAR